MPSCCTATAVTSEPSRLSSIVSSGPLAARFPANSIVIKNTITRDQVFQAISEQTAGSIQELHIFCHSIGGGLYPGYEVSNQDELRNQIAYRAGIKEIERSPTKRP